MHLTLQNQLLAKKLILPSLLTHPLIHNKYTWITKVGCEINQQEGLPPQGSLFQIYSWPIFKECSSTHTENV